MGWKTVKGTQYFYEYVREGGKSRYKCWGYGREAREAAARVERKRQLRIEQAECLKEWSRIDRAVRELSAKSKREVRREVGSRLAKHGYRFVYGHWRKMKEPLQEEAGDLAFAGHLWLEKEGFPPGDLATLSSDDGPTENELRLSKIQDIGTMEHTIRMLALDGLRRTGPDRTLQDYDKIEIQEDAHTKLIHLKEKLRYDQSSEIEKLVIEQIMTAWVQWYVAGWQVETMPMEEDQLKKNHYLERKYSRCQTRLARSLDQLARLRCVPRAYLVDGKPGKGESSGSE